MAEFTKGTWKLNAHRKRNINAKKGVTAKMTDEYVKPCPFCGAMPVLMTGGEHFSYMECPECGVKLPASTGKNRNTDAINAWNRRELSQREKEIIEALKNARKELLRSANGYTKNAINEACAIQDLLSRIDSEKDGDNDE